MQKYNICNIEKIKEILEDTAQELKWYQLKNKKKIVTLGNYKGNSMCLVKKTYTEPYMLAYQNKDKLTYIPITEIDNHTATQYVIQGVCNNISNRIQHLHTREERLVNVCKRAIAM